MIATCNFVIDVNDLHQLNQVVAAIRQLKFVKSVMRLVIKSLFTADVTCLLTNNPLCYKQAQT